MLNFHYKAKNIQGAILTGSLQSPSRQSAITSLKQKGYYLVSLEQQTKALAFLSQNAVINIRITTKDKAIFTHQLAALLKAGMQLTLALKTLKQQTENKHLCSVISLLHEDIEQSSSLSQAMAKHPAVFSKVFTAIINAAEQSGSLPETLEVLAKQLKYETSVKTRIRGAMVYPIFLLFVSAVVVGVLMTFVIPKFTKLFINANQALPLPTKILFIITDSFADYWWFIAIIISSLIGIVLAMIKNPSTRIVVDTSLLKLPLLGRLNRTLQLARFTRTLGSLLNGGVRIITAINITRGTTNNSAFSGEIENIHASVTKGRTLADAIRKQQYFNVITANMVAVGEQTGNLPEMLLDLADIYDEESESIINSITTLLGPMMIVFLGAVIGFVVLAILMPIFQTSTMIS